MKRQWKAAGLGLMAALVLSTTLSVQTAAANPKEPNNEKSKSEDPQEWSDPVLQGTVEKVYWVDGTVKGTWTPTLEFFSKESDVWATVYVDEVGAQELVKNGTACVGRFVVATGNRISQATLSAQGLQVLNPEAACISTLGPPPS